MVADDLVIGLALLVGWLMGISALLLNLLSLDMKKGMIGMTMPSYFVISEGRGSVFFVIDYYIYALANRMLWIF